MSRFTEEFKVIPDMLVRTARIWPDRTAYRWYDNRTNAWLSLTWHEFYERVRKWRRAFAKMGLNHGDRVAMLLPNSIDAITFDQAALANGLVPVPLHAIDTAGSSVFILNNSRARFLVTVSYARWNSLVEFGEDLPHLQQVVLTNESESGTSLDHIPYCGLEEWLATGKDVKELPGPPCSEDLAAIVYTSGTTGRPKGVMLTHTNIVSNIMQTIECLGVTEQDEFLSFLPLSHTFERTVTYYSALCSGACLSVSRGMAQLADDLLQVNPTIMCAVPRVFERFHSRLMLTYRKMTPKKKNFFAWAQEVGWRRFCRDNGLPVEHSAREFLDPFVAGYLSRKAGLPVRSIFGSRMRILIAGGAALNYTVAKFFCGMGVPIRQGYGLTESSPVLSVSRTTGNHPATVGEPLPGTEVRLGEMDELQVRGPQVMRGYWERPEETARAFTEDGWLRTGDQADLSDGGRIRIKGRIKEIIVTSVGEKISPVDLEFAIMEDHLFEQIMVVGENRPFITALVVPNPERWKALCEDLELDPDDPTTMGSRDVRTTVLKRIRAATKNFPRYGQPRNVAIVPESWTVENGLLTTTLKLRRKQICERYAAEIEELYTGHGA